MPHCTAGQCTTSPCTPITECDPNECTTISDGCGNVLHCSETNGVCDCAPRTCDDMPLRCGSLPDGCNGTLQCDVCPEHSTCRHNICQCDAGPEEPNEAIDQAYLPSNDDAIIHPHSHQLEFSDFTLHHEGDQDWLKLMIRNITAGTIYQLGVQLTMPSPSNYRLAIHVQCDADSTISGIIPCANQDTWIHSGKLFCVGGFTNAGQTTRDARYDFACGGQAASAYVMVDANTWINTCEPYRLQVDLQSPYVVPQL